MKGVQHVVPDEEERHLPMRRAVSAITPGMRTGLVVGAAALVILGGGVALAVQNDETACERYRVAAERQDYASFEEAQREQATTLAECMVEQAQRPVR